MNFSLFFDNIFSGLKGLFYNFVVYLFVVLLTSCSVTSRLKKDQYLLYRHKIKGNQQISTETLSEIYKQQPNRKILGWMPYVDIYYFGRKFYDSAKVTRKLEQTKEKFNAKINKANKDKRKDKLIVQKEKKVKNLEQKLKEGNWLMRVPGEAPSFYDSSVTHLTEQQMSYFVHSKGFFNGSVKALVDTNRKKISVTYLVRENKPFIIDRIKYTIKDKKIDSLVELTRKDSPLQTGKKYNENDLTDERDRINDLLKNNGYFDFNRQFIYFNVDTTQRRNFVEIEIVVENPGPGKSHNQYTVSKVVFDADVNAKASEKIDTSQFRKINFILEGHNYSKRILSNKIEIKPGKLFHQKDLLATQKKLATLDMFKFVNINFEKNSHDSAKNTLTAYVRTSPLKKFQITDEAGLTVTSLGFVPGPFGNISFKNRNIFGGFEIFETNVKAAVEGYSSFSNPNVILRTQEYSGNLTLTFPEFLFPARKIRGYFNKMNARTRFLAGAMLINRPEYERLNLKNSYSYNWSHGKYSSSNFSLIDVNIINTLRKTEQFSDYLVTLQKKYGNNLIYSFKNSLVTNSNYSYTFNNNQLGVNEKSHYFKLYLESAGFWWNLLNAAANDKILNLKIYKYVKGNIDVRFYYPTGKKSTFVMRYNLGVAYSYDKEGVLPYEKYFFAGGSNSMRAWRPRRLGPGSYADTTANGEISYKYEKPGDMQIEMNFEYRFHMIGFFDGAFFVDAGNVWRVRADAARNQPGSVFRFNSFYRQIAVGTGFGLRLNFSFLLLRLDVGVKAVDPAEPRGQRFVLPNILQKPPFGPKNQTVLNIGIGYPF